MKVRFTETVDLPTHLFREGREYNLQPEVAQPHLDAGRAVEVKERAVEATPETPEAPRRRRPKRG